MNKSELIDAMAADAGISKGAAKKALESFVMNVSNSLNEGKRVSLVGFGSFSVSNRAAREGRNPQTGKTISIAAKNVVKFKPGAELDGGVNNGSSNGAASKDTKDTKAPAKAAKK